jgi:hypothetical protein
MSAMVKNARQETGDCYGRAYDVNAYRSSPVKTGDCTRRQRLGSFAVRRDAVSFLLAFRIRS